MARPGLGFASWPAEFLPARCSGGGTWGGELGPNPVSGEVTEIWNLTPEDDRAPAPLGMQLRTSHFVNHASLQPLLLLTSLCVGGGGEGGDFVTLKLQRVLMCF